jgi:hypothetical protein
MNTVDTAIQALLGATGLSENEAKIAVYWAIATNGLEVLECYPLLLIQGQPSTGKSTILKTIQKLSSAKFVSTTSPAEFRDILVKHPVVLIEEADTANEDLLLKRYSRETGHVNIKSKGSKSSEAYTSVKGNLYGATAIHRRYALEILALQSRTIVIKTKKCDKSFSSTPLEDSIKVECKTIWESAWGEYSDYNPQGRTGANWRALIIVAKFLQDFQWLLFAEEQQQLADSLLNEDGEWEPEQLIQFALEDLKKNENSKLIYLYTLIEHLTSHYGCKPSSKGLAKMLREKGYVVEHHHNGHAVELV